LSRQRICGCKAGRMESRTT